ncbi:hypothetical protein CYMTET_42908 [Cymbomonas tetramitiformis]|uniref:CASTOR/POLLUX/SYM8 ion channel conserved domain-containing protein n=1 Tax=Cymbomonas tetramitiformis TaxID=36881 RepID=A0AAE0F265_9CHLO|nr:hypothetical protein CYMTET_42908 [Cymbomonas tetramitiformis]
MAKNGLTFLGSEHRDNTDRAEMMLEAPEVQSSAEYNSLGTPNLVAEDTPTSDVPIARPNVRIRKSETTETLTNAAGALSRALAFEQDLLQFVNLHRTKLHEQAVYQLEKALVSTSGGKLYFMMVLSAASAIILACIWALVGFLYCGCDRDGDSCDEMCVGNYDGWSPGTPLWVAWSFIISTSYQPFESWGERIAVSAMILVGLILFAVVVGLISEGFSETIDQLKSGKTKAVEKNHTLILGFNQTTPSLVSKLAIFREKHISQLSGWRGWRLLLLNPRKYRYVLNLGRVKYPIFTGRIVILASGISREEMEDRLEQNFRQESVNTHYTMLNRDVLLRIGEEANLTQLCRVSVSEASRIVVMLDERDKELASAHEVTTAEEPTLSSEDYALLGLGRVKSGGGGEFDSTKLKVRDSSSVRVLLALRYLLKHQHQQGRNLHVIAQLSHLSSYVRSMNWEVQVPGQGNQLAMTLLDVDFKLTSFMLSCVGQPGLASALGDMLDRQGVSVKVRSVEKLDHECGIQLSGKKFEDVLAAFGNHLLMGMLRTNQAEEKRKILLNPEPGETLHPTDEVIILGEGEPYPTPPGTVFEVETTPRNSKYWEHEIHERDESKLSVLFCGWRKAWSAPEVFGHCLKELCKTCVNCSQLTFLNTMSDDGNGIGEWPELFKAAVDAQKLTEENCPVLKHIKHEVGYSNDPKTLCRVGAENFTTFVLISTSFSDENHVNVSIRDSRVLTSVMAITQVKQEARDKYAEKKKPVPASFRNCNVISEIADDQLRLLITNFVADRMGGHSEFFNVSDLVGSLIAQICYNPVMDSIWQYLLNKGGSDMQCLPAHPYALPEDGEITFWEMMQRVRSKNATDICLGYVELSVTGKAEATLAPPLNRRRKWAPKDKLIIMSAAGEPSDVGMYI